MTKYHYRCSQCGGILSGYYQFNICGGCYSNNISEKQRAALKKQKEDKQNAIINA